ncbi:DUF4391 domain-containing protein [Flavobacterium filum]|uniref:DUF4391 domain-containing protein n=1 Tax=Flavobacterium filum TaxID=370974 RepID=UPI000424ECE6|nr:DUF4391 domain-containing protein [Flavobacterium filum]
MAVALLHKALHLPHACWVNQKLPKTFFKRNFDLTLTERKLLDDFSIIQQMEILASVNVETANIPAYVDEVVTYEEINILAIQTTNEQFDRQKHKIIELVQKYIPNPMLVMIYDNQQMVLNVTEKRINNNDVTKRVIEKLYTTVNLQLPINDPKNQAFIESIAFEKANKLNLQNYYQHFIQCFIGLQTAQINGTFVARPYQRSKEDALLLEEIEALKETIYALENQAKKETQVSEMVQLNTKIQEHRNKIQELKTKLSN